MRAKNLLLNLLKDFVLAILAGFTIGIGGTAFLLSTNVVAGAFFFCVGLFIILLFKLNLFTGKVCYVLDNKPSYMLSVLIIWLGNFVGTVLVANLLKATRLISMLERCSSISTMKLNDGLWSLFILGIFCNILIYVAVHAYNKSENNVTKACGLFFGVMVFVVCGFEHCIADMFYFAFSGDIFSLRAIGVLLIVTLGNIVGGNLIPVVMKLLSLIKTEAVDQPTK